MSSEKRGGDYAKSGLPRRSPESNRGAEAGEKEYLPKEIEVKIINLGDPAEFIKRLEALGGVITRPRRLLRTLGFNLKSEKIEKSGSVFTFSSADFCAQGASALPTGQAGSGGSNSLSELISTLRYLGAKIDEDKDGQITISMPKDIKKFSERDARIRRDGEETTLTVKQKRKKGAEVDERVEKNVSVVNPQTAMNLLKYLGYEAAYEREKYRATYRLGKAVVELNESPLGAPWAEVEAESPEKVLKIVKLLGYAKADTAAISDGEYLRRQAISKEQAKNLVFNKG
jgi:predicted adenylyl cyclase CyaB